MPSTDTPRRTRGNLPAELSSFVGRRREVGQIKQLVATSRLVTLTGVGGTGKSRLALHTAGEIERGFPDGVWLIDLAEVRGSGLSAGEGQDAELVGYVLMTALGAREDHPGPAVQQLSSYLASRQALLILDNCEHVLPATAIVVRGLLVGCPRLRVLATSREPLAVPGEVVYPVPPLPVPGAGAHPGPADLVGCESMALFTARARDAVPDLVLNEADYDSVAELCRRLDGLPLSIELAAARLRVLAPRQILDRLTDRFTLLSRGNRSAPTRQQTLRACVDWSYELCDRQERLLWERLSVFVGGFDLTAAEDVCTDEAVPVRGLVDVLAGLVGKSIVERVESADGRGVRYRMLETLRDYGAERLIRSGALPALRRRHADWYRRLAETASREWISDRQTAWYARLIQEHANLRAAVEFSLTTPGEAETALRIVLRMPRLYWWSRGMFREGLGWLDRGLAQVTAPTPLRARALLLASYLATWHSDPGMLRRMLDEGEHLARELNDPGGLADAAFVRGYTALLHGNLISSIHAVEDGAAILAQVRERDPALWLHLLLVLAGVAVLAGAHDRGWRWYQEAYDITESRGESFSRSTAAFGLAFVAWRQGRTGEAGNLAARTVEIEDAAQRGDRFITALSIEILAWIATEQQQYRRAATLLGITDAILGEHGRSRPAMLAAEHDARRRTVREALGGAAFGMFVDHGRALSLEDAVAYALGRRRVSGPASPPVGATAAPLTPRERQIADLVARGLTNRDIATKLVISRRTAETHIENILAKLGFSNRAQVAAWVAGCTADSRDG